MTHAFIAIVILIAIMVLFVTEALPLPVTAMLGAVAMAVTSVIGFDQAFKGFSNDAFMMVAGLLVIGQAVCECGLIHKVGGFLHRLVSLGERKGIVLFSLIAGGLSAFLSNTAVSAMFMPVIDSMAVSTGKPSVRAALSMPVGAAAVLGGTLTLIGSVPQLIAQGFLEEAGAPTMEMFTLFKVGFPLFAICVAYYATIGRRLLVRSVAKRQTALSENAAADSELRDAADSLEAELVAEQESASLSSAKMAITAAVFILVVLGFVLDVWTMGTCAIAGALVLIATKCISLKAVVHRVEWSPVVILGGSLGFCAGLQESGAGEMIARVLIDLCGGSAAHPLVLLALMVVIAGLLSNFMANTAVTAMLVPIGMVLSQAMGSNPLAMAIGIVFAANYCVATPIGTVPMTLTLGAGYRFVDYLKVGGPIWLIMTAATILLVPLAYGL